MLNFFIFNQFEYDQTLFHWKKSLLIFIKSINDFLSILQNYRIMNSNLYNLHWSCSNYTIVDKNTSYITKFMVNIQCYWLYKLLSYFRKILSVSYCNKKYFSSYFFLCNISIELWFIRTKINKKYILNFELWSIF